MKPYYSKDGITIYHGDCREVLPGLEPESVRLLWTDPPYGHSNQDGDLQSARVRDGVKGARVKECEPIANDSPEMMREAVDEALRLAVPLLSPDCCCCCCCCCGGGGPKPTFAWVANRMDADGLSFFHAVVWDKSDRGNGLGWRFRRNYEFVMVSHRKSGKLAWAEDAIAAPNVIRMAPPTTRIHPNEKPLDLIQRFIRWTTRPGDLVLDPFMGAGTTLVAAQLAGLPAIGIEVDERWCEAAANRLAQGVLPFGARETVLPGELKEVP